jgi:hypothetical protein
MHLIEPLAAGVAGCEGGSVLLYRRGTSTFITYYTTYEGAGATTPVAAVALDANGGGIFYVNETTNCIVRDSTGTTIRTFVAGPSSSSIEVKSTSFTGTNYDTALTGVGEPLTLKAALDKWVTSAGTTDFKVLVGGVAVNLQTAVAALGVLFFSVKDPTYGAVGDGSTDDTSAVQATLNAASAAGGGTVFFPKGTYMINAGVGISVPANVSLLGAGPGASVIRLDINAGSGLCTFETSAHMRTVVGLRFDANVSTTRSMVRSAATVKLAVRDCYFGGSTFDGIGISLAAGTAAELHVYDSTFYTSSNSIVVSTGVAATIVGCTFVLAAAPTASVLALGAANPIGFLVAGCYFDSTLMASGAISLIVNTAGNGGMRGALIGNYCANPAGGTINLWTGVGVDSATNDGALILGNRFGSAITRSALWGGSALASTYRGVTDGERERARYYVADDTGAVSLSPMTYALAEVVRTTTGIQTVTLDGPGPVNCDFTLVYHNNHGSGGGTITMAGNVKGLTTFTVNASSVSYYFFKSVHRGTSKYWVLKGSTVNVTA